MKKFLVIFTVAILSFSTLTACSSQEITQNTTQTDIQQTQNKFNADRRMNKNMGTPAQITAIDGNCITLKLSSMTNNNLDKEKPNSPTGKPKEEVQFNGKEITINDVTDILKTVQIPERNSMPSKNGMPQNPPHKDMPSDNRKPFENNIPQNGEIPEPKEPNYETLSISEISIGDIVNVIYDSDNETIKYIVKNNIPHKKTEETTFSSAI